MQLKIEQLDDVEVVPGITWSITWADITAEVDADGDIEQIDLHGGTPTRPVKICLHHRCQYPELWRGLSAAILRTYRDEIAEHVQQARACDADPYYGRLLPQEMR